MEVDAEQRQLERCGCFSEHPLTRPGEQRNDLSWTRAATCLVHQRSLCVVDDLHHLLRPALATESCRQLWVRVPEDDHEARNEPARNDANLLDQAFLDPE